MLDEGVQIIRQMWTDGVGHARRQALPGRRRAVPPRPLQGTTPGVGNGIPMWIAGGGEKKTLRIAAQYADYTNFDGSPEGFAHKSEILKQHCDDLGRDFGSIVRSANYNVVIGANEKEVKDRLAWHRDHFVRAGLSEQDADSQVADLAKQPAVGTPDQIVETFKALERQGMTYAITYFQEAAYDTSGIDLFENYVIPELASKSS